MFLEIYGLFNNDNKFVRYKYNDLIDMINLEV